MTHTDRADICPKDGPGAKVDPRTPVTSIYVCTHKRSEMPPISEYVPILCGASMPDRKELKDGDHIRDDAGENISLKNPYYSELTGMYWAWKNDHTSSYIGLCHYRRFLLDANGKLFTESSVRDTLKKYDAITTKRIMLDHPYREAFGGKHNPRDFELLEEVVALRSPEYIEDFRRIAGGRETYFGNMLICRRDLFADYSAWLFELLFAVEEKVDMTAYNDYQKRLYGFLSELLLMVYLQHKGLRVLECDVAVLGGKKETQEALDVIAGYFRKGDLDGASAYYMELYRRRPDILMEASDVNGDLKLVTQMLATFQAEKEQTGHCYLEREHELQVLLSQFRELNEAIKHGEYAGLQLSDTAVSIAEKLMKKQ